MRVKKELKELFDKCNTYGEIFKAMGAAKKDGFNDAEINTAASYRKNALAKETSSNYKMIPTEVLDLSVNRKFMTTNISVGNIASNQMLFDGTVFTL